MCNRCHRDSIPLYLTLLLILGKKLTSLTQLREVDRNNEPPLNGTCCDVMWSDPLLEELLAEMNIKTDADYEEFLELDYLPNILRGCSSIFGHGSIQAFLKVLNGMGLRSVSTSV